MTNITINNKGYWESDTTQGHMNDPILRENLLEFLKKNNIKTLLDFGCGTGFYVSRFLENKIECKAYDGNPNTPILSNGIGDVLDLSVDIDLDHQYECVLSLEVGEHIPKQYEDIFINNICKHSSKWIVISWAIIGQAGDGHVNCQNNDYIISKITQQKFEYCPTYTNFLRNNSSLFWFKNTLMVFKYIEIKS